MTSAAEATVIRSASNQLDCLLIVGPARSGTSFVSSCAHFSGFDCTIAAAHHGNFEDEELGAEIISSGGLFSDSVRRLIEGRSASGRLWSFKYPPVAESMIALRANFPKAGLVLVTRDPALAAWHDTTRTAIDFGERLIDTSNHLQRLVEAAIRAVDTPLLWIPFDVTRENPVGVASAMHRFAGRGELQVDPQWLSAQVASAHEEYSQDATSKVEDSDLRK